MQISENTLGAMTKTLRVFDGQAEHITKEQADELTLAIANWQPNSKNALQLTIAVQALLFSARSGDAAKSLLRRLTDPAQPPLIASELALLSRSLDPALFECYREADPILFDDIIDFDALTADFELLANATSVSPQRRINVALGMLNQLTHVASSLLVPLLNSEHQKIIIRLLILYLESVARLGTEYLDPAQLLTILRRCSAPPRFTLDLPAIAQLRDKARGVAAQHLSMKVDIDPFAPQANRALSYRFLLVGKDVEKQTHHLSGFFEEFLEKRTDSSLGLVVNCASWTQESSGSQELLALCETIFRDDVATRSPASFLAMCTRFGDIERGREWLHLNSKKPATAAGRFLEAKFLRAIGDNAGVLVAASKPLSVYGNAYDFPKVQATSDGDTDETPVKVWKDLPAMDGTILYNTVRLVQEATFLRDVGKFSSNCRKTATFMGLRLPNPFAKSSRTARDVTLILAPNHIPFVAQLPVPAIEKARLDGAEVVSLILGHYPSSTSLSKAAALLNQALIAPFYFAADAASHVVSSDWVIDADQKQFEYKGINYYAGMHNSLGIIFRRFTLDFSDELVKSQVNRHLVMFQSIHDIFGQFMELREPSRLYQFVVVGVQYGVGYALRTLISAAGADNVRLIHASNGYEAFDAQWATDPVGGNAVASFHSIRDLTDHPSTPLSFRPTPSDCLETISSSEADYMKDTITSAYVQKIDMRHDAALSRSVARNDGKRRVLMLGTILPDLSIPQDTGFVHADIAAWVQDTARIVDSADNVTLVVKQHPAELQHKIGFYVSERFAELVPQGLKNIEILDYKAPFHDAVLNSDLVVLWSGTSTLELALMAKPYIACSRFAQEEYPLYADHPQSPNDYADMILGRRHVASRSDARLRAIDVIYRTSSSPVREPSVWPKRQLLNAQVWPVAMNPDLAAAQMADPAVKRLAKRLVSRE